MTAKITARDCIPVAQQARLLAEFIKRTGQTRIACFPKPGPDAREFDRVLRRELAETIRTPEGWERLVLPERYEFVPVDQSDYDAGAIKRLCGGIRAGLYEARDAA